MEEGRLVLLVFMLLPASPLPQDSQAGHPHHHYWYHHQLPTLVNFLRSAWPVVFCGCGPGRDATDRKLITVWKSATEGKKEGQEGKVWKKAPWGKQAEHLYA